MYVVVSSEKMAYYSDIERPKLILRTRRCIEQNQTLLLKSGKRRWKRLAKRLVGL